MTVKILYVSNSRSTLSGPFGGRFELEILSDREGVLIFKATGNNAAASFRHEAGGHRFQRVPETERSGRVHTSTITIAVLASTEAAEIQLNDSDFSWTAIRGSGAGGQARNKTSNCIMLTHKPSGITVRVENGRSQHQNLQTAKTMVLAKIRKASLDAAKTAMDATRKRDLGTGQRGDKIRTIALQRDQVIDHTRNHRMTATQYLKGNLDALYD